MGIHLITGHAGTPHVTSDDQRHQNAILHGSGAYLVSGCDCTIDANKAKISQGELFVNGAYVRIDSGGVEAPVTSGTVGTNRIDYVVLRYEVALSGVESVSIIVKRGTTQPPSVQSGSILDGATVAEFPLYRLDLNGTAITVGQRLIASFNATEVLGLGSLAFKSAIAASDVTSGTLADARIPSLNASKITAGTFDAARIPTLATSKISGVTDAAKAGNWISAVGHDTSTGWAYIKFTDGTAVCYKIHNVGDKATNVSWGRIYYNSTKVTVTDFPFNFTYTPAVSMWEQKSDSFPLGCSGSEGASVKNPGKFWVCGVTNSSHSCTVGIIAVGRWK